LKNLIQRIISGIFYLGIIIGALFLGPYAFFAVFFVITLIALYEFYGIALASGASPFVIPSLLIGAFFYIISFLVSTSLAQPKLLLLAIPLVFFLLITAMYSNRPDVIRNTAVSILGLAYVSVPMAALNFMAFPASNDHFFTYRMILGVLILIWVNDSGAYVVGMLIGRNKLFERISPKKSWEGAIGGAVFTLLIALWMSRIVGILGRLDWLALALLVSVLGVVGDLVESLFKRSVDLKDSGNLIPGHGGMLDRIDSLLFVMPLALVYLVLTNRY
jgi:phosphatidate cytidylyltransferase